MMEYDDGRFGEIMPKSEMMEKLQKMFDVGQTPKALHFGTVEELEAKKEEKTMQEKLDELAAKVKKLEPVVTKRIIPPSAQDIISFGQLFD